MIYLDNAATSFPKPEIVYTSMDTFYRTMGANPGRSGHRMAVTKVKNLSCGFINPDDVKNAITPKTRLIVLTHATNVLGTIQPIKEIGLIARERDIVFMVD